MLSRRQFVAWISSAVPLALVARRADALAARWMTDDALILRAVSEAVLPTEIGRDGAARAAREFQQWVDDYRDNAEIVHGYGTSALSVAPPSPRAKWAAQLLAWRRFPEMSLDDRRAAVRAAVRAVKLERMPAVNDAPHVSIALLSHFYHSSAANDLCYQAQIGRELCRPLAAVSRKPLPLAGRRT